MRSIIIVLAFLIPFSILGQAVTIQVINPTVSGNQVTYDVIVDDFIDIAGFQYGMAYDTTVLKFVRTQNYNLPDLDETLFGTNDPGFIETLWFDLTTEGITVPDSTVIYQMVFEMASDTFGTLCFTQDSVAMEFFNPDLELQSVYVVDDCHTEPFLFVDHTTGVKDVVIQHGLSISVLNSDRSISFALEDEATLEFGLYDIKGSQIASIARQNYAPGKHVIDIGVQMPQGIYVLTTTIRNQPVAMKVVFQ